VAAVLDQPELKARHLALAAVRGDPDTLAALDRGARMARGRGAPAAAAELLTLAVSLGGDAPERQTTLARHLLDAGDTERARRLLEQVSRSLPPGTARAWALSRLAIVRLHDDSYRDAAELLEQALHEAGDDLRLRAQVLIELPYALLNLARGGQAIEFIEDAVLTSERLGDRHLISQALGMRAVLRFLAGHGLQREDMDRALADEERHTTVAVMFRPGVQVPLLRAWTDQLDQGRDAMRLLRQRCVERGEENDLIFLTFHSVLIETWRGSLGEAARLAEDCVERARLLGGDVPLGVALSVRAHVAAHLGDHGPARRDALEASTIYQRCGWHSLAEWPITTLGFLELSLGRDEAALRVLAPLLQRVRAGMGSGEIVACAFLPDAVEAQIRTGELAQAEALVDQFETFARRVDRTWVLATGGRCRAMLLATQGELDGATRAAELAMIEHQRLPMPFERARTQLLLGQLQRRGRHKDTAATSLGEALRAFDELGATLWSQRARAELQRVNSGPSGPASLTPSEQRVAELAATGMTNREVASALFISPKTVEANLARAHRKLGIRSRAELDQRMAAPGG
jgi:DNA-binding CsgD family transcriptional regulator